MVDVTDSLGERKMVTIKKVDVVLRIVMKDTGPLRGCCDED